MYNLLTEIVAAIETIPEIKTVAIGTESGISAKDTPAARVVTEYRELSARSKQFDQGAIQVLLLLDLKNDLPEVYRQSIELEDKIRNAVKEIATFNRTDYDQDSVTVFKVSIMRFTFTGIRNGLTECNL